MIGRYARCDSPTWDEPQYQHVRCHRWITHPGLHEGRDRDGNVLAWANTDPIPTGQPTPPAGEPPCDSADSGRDDEKTVCDHCDMDLDERHGVDRACDGKARE